MMEVIVNRAGWLFKRGRNILREEGLIAFIREVTLFFVRSFFISQTVYIYENALDGPEVLPKTQNATLEIIVTPEQLDELVANGFDIASYYHIGTLKQRISKGVVLFCVFMGREIAHISWAALNEKTKREVDLPITTDFQTEAVVGNAETRPRYRMMGLYTYVYSQIYRFLKEQGYLKAKFTTAQNNIPPQKAQAKLGSKIVGEAHYLKLLRKEFWREKAIAKNNKGG